MAEDKLSHARGGKSLLAGTGIYLGSNILNAAIPFALLPILTRYLSPEEYGEVAMFQMWLGILMAVMGLSLHGAAIRKYYDAGLTRNQLGEFIGSCLQILLGTAAVTLISCLLAMSYLNVWLGLRAEWILAGVVVTVCLVVIQIRLGQWQARTRAAKYGALQVSKSVIDFALSLIFVVALLQGGQGRIEAQVWAAILVALFALFFLRRDGLLRLSSRNNKEYVKEALRFGVPLIPHAAGAFLLLSVDRFIINNKLGLRDVGIYMVAVQFGAGISLILDAVNKAYVPWLFERLRRDSDHEKREVVLFTYKWYLVLLLGAGLAFLVGPWMITIVAGKSFAPAAKIFGWIALGQAFKGMYLMQTNYIFYSKRTGILAGAAAVSGVVNVLLILYLIKPFGLLGVAYSFAASMVLFFVLTWAASQRRHPMPWLKTLIDGGKGASI